MNEPFAYEVTGRIGRLTLNRPERGNGITRRLVSELEQAVERADLDPAVHVLLLSGRGKGFCGGYDLVESAERRRSLGDSDAPPGSALDPTAEALANRIARLPVNQLQMMKLLVNQSLYSQGLHATQLLGTLFDGAARHTKEGYAFQALAARDGFKEAVRERDEPFGDWGR